MTHEATATVVTCEAVISGGLHAAGGGGGIVYTFNHEDSLNYDLILDVSPDGSAAPFRAKTSMRFGIFHHPKPGDTLRVRCNPEHQTVKIDVSEDERFNPRLYEPAEKRRQEDEANRTLNAPPGTPAEGDDPELDELIQLEHESMRKRDGG